jgi:hypothetical protein
MIKESLVDNQTRENRLNLCKKCPNLFALTGNCKLCGCFVSLKTKLKNQKCPIEKW